MSDKIMIIDDKPITEDYSSRILKETFGQEHLGPVDFYFTYEQLWVIDDSDLSVQLLMDFNKYQFVFIHASQNNDSFLLPVKFKNRIITEISKNSKVVLFSGQRPESKTIMETQLETTDKTAKPVYYFEIKREQYFKNMSNFIDSKIILDNFQLKFLYNPMLKPKREKGYMFLEKIKRDLETSVEKAIESESFKELVSLCGKEEHYLKGKEMYKNLEYNVIIERLKKLINDEIY
jgi:hypothetical protein